MAGLAEFRRAEKVLGEDVLFYKDAAGWYWHCMGLRIAEDQLSRHPSLRQARIHAMGLIYSFSVVEEMTARPLPPDAVEDLVRAARPSSAKPAAEQGSEAGG